MIKKAFLFVSLIGVLALTQCSSSSGLGTFVSPRGLAIDQTNDRLFVFEQGPELYAYTASTQNGIGDQPSLSEDNDDNSVFENLPQSIVKIASYSLSSGSTRLFFLGQARSGETLVTNQVVVFDFDGTSYTQPFANITLSDGDSSTTDLDNTFFDAVVDQSNGILYITDTSAGLVHVIDVTDGTQASSPLTVAGQPAGMSLDNGYLYVCNITSTAAQQVITVFDVSDYSSTTIDLDEPCGQLSVLTNGSNTVMVVSVYDEAKILLREVNTITYSDSSALDKTSGEGAIGVLSVDDGIDTSVQGLLLNSSGDGFNVYLAETNGSVQYLSIEESSEILRYRHQTLLTSVLSLSQSQSFSGEDADGETVNYGFIVGESGALLRVTLGSTNIEVID